MYPTHVSNLRYAPFDYMKKILFPSLSECVSGKDDEQLTITCRLQLRLFYVSSLRPYGPLILLCLFCIH